MVQPRKPVRIVQQPDLGRDRRVLACRRAGPDQLGHQATAPDAPGCGIGQCASSAGARPRRCSPIAVYCDAERAVPSRPVTSRLASTASGTGARRPAQCRPGPAASSARRRVWTSQQRRRTFPRRWRCPAPAIACRRVEGTDVATRAARAHGDRKAGWPPRVSRHARPSRPPRPSWRRPARHARPARSPPNARNA